MTIGKALTAAERREVAKLYVKDGISMKVLGAQFRKNPVVIRKILVDEGVTITPRSNPEFIPTLKEIEEGKKRELAKRPPMPERRYTEEPRLGGVLDRMASTKGHRKMKPSGTY